MFPKRPASSQTGRALLRLLRAAASRGRSRVGESCFVGKGRKQRGTNGFKGTRVASRELEESCVWHLEDGVSVAADVIKEALLKYYGLK